MKSHRKKYRMAGIFIILVICGLALVLYRNSNTRRYEEGQLEIIVNGTDKARYAPKEEAAITVTVRNVMEETADDILLDMKVYHLDQVVYSEQQDLALKPGEEKELASKWQTPDSDYQG